MHVNLPVARNLVPQEVMQVPVPNAAMYRASIKRQPKSNNESSQQHQTGLINRSSIRLSSSALNRSGLSRAPLRESLLESEHSACFVDPNQQTLGGNVHSDDAPASQERHKFENVGYGKKHVSDDAANRNHLGYGSIDTSD